MFALPAAELRYLSRRGTQDGRVLHGRPLRMHVFAYAQQSIRTQVHSLAEGRRDERLHMSQDIGRSPRDVLGVGQEADGQEIKTAFRKLALKYHPDHQGGDEERFVEILRAYEILVGKADGKDGREHADWDFHDWYWKFTTLRKQGKMSPKRGAFHADLPSQLAGLRQRAAVRAAKARAEQRTSASGSPHDPTDEYQDDAESPADCGAASSSTMTEDQMRRYTEEARRRAQLSSSETKESISNQLTGLKRRAQIRHDV